MKISGAMTAIVTPFQSGAIDERALRALVDWQISNGVDGIVPCGSTGEAMTLTHEERDRVVRIVVEQTAGRALVIAGAGSNCTETAVRLGKAAKKAGADAQLQVTPYYIKPPQEGLYQHFSTIAKLVDMPMVLYNVPGRTAVNMLPETISRLASIENIVAVKESSHDLDQVKKVIECTPDDFHVLSGEDDLNFNVYALGGDGCISVTGNIVPEMIARVWDEFSSGSTSNAKALQERLSPLNKAMFLETNPIPVKTALSMMGKIREEFRLPLVPISETAREHLRVALTEHGLL